MRGKFFSYLRVSTDKQGERGYGLDAQRKAVEDFLNGGNWELIGEYVEIDSCAREPYEGNIARPKPAGGCQIGCCTAESRPPPPTGLWQRWVMSPRIEA